jgi:hypothetical protein
LERENGRLGNGGLRGGGGGEGDRPRGDFRERGGFWDNPRSAPRAPQLRPPS